jgi:hypothetical protein
MHAYPVGKPFQCCLMRSFVPRASDDAEYNLEVAVDPNDTQPENFRLRRIHLHRERRAAARGLISDSVPVTVGKPAISVLVQPTLADTGQSGILLIQLFDQTGSARPTSEAVTFRIVSSDPSVVTADSTVAVTAGQGQSIFAAVHFGGAGSAVLRVLDDRNVPYAYEPGASAIIQVIAAQSP